MEENRGYRQKISKFAEYESIYDGKTTDRRNCDVEMNLLSDTSTTGTMSLSAVSQICFSMTRLCRRRW